MAVQANAVVRFVLEVGAKHPRDSGIQELENLSKQNWIVIAQIHHQTLSEWLDNVGG